MHCDTACVLRNLVPESRCVLWITSNFFDSNRHRNQETSWEFCWFDMVLEKILREFCALERALFRAKTDFTKMVLEISISRIVGKKSFDTNETTGFHKLCCVAIHCASAVSHISVRIFLHFHPLNYDFEFFRQSSQMNRTN